ncbi:MAG: 23S rRNA (uracil(1939)-C(5))-methyltransferase RlmD [Chloroflexi bacterium AL-W]|nr:23S rRNA (uracil(1939)-C(5))-methyltransferase RlmD [Chloroflexi bacterium AL-N1]NOK66210.1 23S rRNA (uracil(1939)-C(5))-methyltransferase RlmD [Chloroflexi bacterium AL-N10]NOK73091.1 23S rRNA (uracil(1939)-C(5))-methyltransferase RlmD [Chloroflexi bacterium AL-N5]NOK79988.1 23S rRNA (uracil(1939)-C(5))-methyltransferase RlmD [Chloroflexi bacterium AL-W]NOK88156.1 23S rRNA (uracil(1939)-C(5))-methyltransferase RlmD [Chloroflexi bacterium AL-N15]
MTHWPEVVELTLDGIAQGGDGVGRWQGRVVFATGGLPGEQVCVQLTEQRAAFARGHVIELITTAPERVPPRLPGTDHMSWQHIAYPAQLDFKRQILTDQLAKIAGLADLVIAEVIPSASPWHYRNAARLHVEQTAIGYFAAGSRTLQPIESDPLLLPSLNDALAAIHHVIEPEDHVYQIILRMSETQGNVVAELGGEGDLWPLAQRWRDACPALSGVAVPGLLSHGETTLIEQLDGVTLSLQPTVFFQVNLMAAKQLLHMVYSELSLQGDERLLDLYSGVGTFALPLSHHVHAVLGIEEHSVAVANARKSAAEHHLTNARILQGRVEHTLIQIDESFDCVVLDPPRRGCHQHVLDELLRYMPERMVYVSCNPATLARDLKVLVAGGYHVARVQPIDLFPQTPHIETLCTLVRNK